MNKNIDIFCSVIDNFGDAGYTLRVAASLKNQYKDSLINIYTDCTELFFKLMPGRYKTSENGAPHINIFPIDSGTDYCASEVVLGMFQFFPDERYIEVINRKSKIFIGVDYFTAELWAKDLKALPLMHQGLKIKTLFFVPNVHAESSGILRFSWKSPGFPTDVLDPRYFFNAYLYDYGPIEKLSDVLYPLSQEAVFDWRSSTQNRFFTQDEFDEILYSSRYNWIRGEDSFSLALWSGIPFFWQAYKQKETRHFKKVWAFNEFIKPFFEDAQMYKRYVSVVNTLNGIYQNDITDDFLYMDKKYGQLKDVFEKMKEYFLKQKTLQQNLMENIEYL